MPTRIYLESDYPAIRAAVLRGLNSNPYFEAQARRLNHSPARFRWDAFRAGGATRERHPITDTTLLDRIYEDRKVTDAHIDSALRRAMRELGSNWGAQK